MVKVYVLQKRRGRGAAGRKQLILIRAKNAGLLPGGKREGKEATMSKRIGSGAWISGEILEPKMHCQGVEPWSSRNRPPK